MLFMISGGLWTRLSSRGEQICRLKDDPGTQAGYQGGDSLVPQNLALAPKEHLIPMHAAQGLACVCRSLYELMQQRPADLNASGERRGLRKAQRLSLFITFHGRHLVELIVLMMSAGS